MAVPTLDELHRPVLEIASSAPNPLTRRQFVEQLTTLFSLTEADLRELIPSGAQTRIENRTNWAMTDLKKAGLINNPQRNQWQITRQGQDYLANHQGIIKLVELQKLWLESAEDSEVPASNIVDSAENTPEEQIAKGYQQQRDRLSEEILESMYGLPPAGFERLVNGLLEVMGYGKVEQNEGRTGDQGIDGILNQDALGLEKVYVQAKRYDTAQVGEPEIRNFSGSLVAKGAAKGIFITTSAFSTTAQQTAGNISMGNQFIRLIDGKELAQLMIRHGVGVITEITYEIKKLDANYFTDV